MNDPMRKAMAEATQLTREGKLLEATAMIQRTLGVSAPVVTRPDGPPSSGEGIDVPYRVVEEAGAAQRSRPRGTGPDAHLLLPGSAAPASSRQPTEAPDFHSSPHPWRRVASVHQHPSSGEEAGRFLTMTYTNAAGTRSYKLFIPHSYQGQAVPLLVMLHGCTQDADDFATGTRMNGLAEEHTFLVVYPEQTKRANGARCWNWFERTHQRRDAGEPSIIAGITREVMATFHVDPQRVYVSGMSAGGAMAAVMAATYPDLYAAAGIHSGLPYGAADTLQGAVQVMRGDAPTGRMQEMAGSRNLSSQIIPTIVFHGDRDRTVSPENADRMLDQRSRLDPEGGQLRVVVRPGKVRGGRAYTRSIYYDAHDQVAMEKWTIHGAGHAWSGGNPAGTFTDPKGPDASREMVRFFHEHPRV